MEEKELICINCPMGCGLTVRVDGDHVTVSGNSCPKGADYGKKEVLNPTRIVTSGVTVHGGTIARVSVKTQSDIPKAKIFDVMREIRAVELHAPVRAGDVVIGDCAGTGVPVIATKTVEAARG